MSLDRGLQPQTGDERAPFRQLGFELLFNCECMFCDSARVVVLGFLFKLDDAAAQLEIFRDGARQFAFEFSYAEGSDVIILGKFSILAKHLLSN